MAKRSNTDADFERIRDLKSRDPSSVTDSELAQLLNSKNSATLASLAPFVATHRRTALIPNLLESFEHFARDGAKTDKGCLAKLAIANALCSLDHRDHAVYLRGVRTFQPESSYGGKVDTAGELRGRCAEALVTTLYPHALIEIAPLLADKEPQCRVGAVRAASLFIGDAGAALLRFKLTVGDEEPVVLGEACAALLAIDANLHAEFVATFFDPPESDLAQAAFAALVENKSPAGLIVLKTAYDRAISAGSRKAALAAIAKLRVDGSTTFLLTLIESSLHIRAREVIECLIPLKHDDPFRDRLTSALTRRDDALLTRYAHEILK